MSKNCKNVSQQFWCQINDKCSTDEEALIQPLNIIKAYDPSTHVLIRQPGDVLKDPIFSNIVEIESQSPPLSLVYEVVYPDDLNLKPSSGSLKPRGRPKRAKIDVEKPSQATDASTSKVVQKTRSGRTVKFPKYIEKEFKKIEINDDLSANPGEEIRVSDFPQQHYKIPPGGPTDRSGIEHVELQQKKRRISAQYRCPKCQRAYLGKSKILDHLKKNPTHGPFQGREEIKNFEVWNYLVCVTQKSPSSERGTKFCQELSNVLHNLLLLANALFKKWGGTSNEVKIDNVLGNAIGLSPGSYYFDDNNLYKDVTVLKLMSNNDFLNSIKTKTDDDNSSSVSSSENQCRCKKANEIKSKISSKVLDGKNVENPDDAKAEQEPEPPQDPAGEESFYQNNSDLDSKYFRENDYEMKPANDNKVRENFTPKTRLPSTPKLFKDCGKNVGATTANIKNTVGPDLISDDNSVLASVSNLRHSVDDLMLPPASSGSVLDNSSSSDEVMNVDQFVIERFKKITEPEMDVTNGSALNVDIPGLDLFNFHAS